MSFTTIIIITLVILLLVLVIIGNVMQQQKQQRETKRRQETALQKAIIDETEEMLLLHSKLPMSKDVVIALQTRNLNALKAMAAVNPQMAELEQRANDMEKQIADTNRSYRPISENNFVVPDNEKAAIAVLQALKKLRLILRSEHNKGLVSPSTLMEEEKSAERLSLRINLDNLFGKAQASIHMVQIGSARQLLDKAHSMMNGVASTDDYIMGKRQQLEQMQAQLDKMLQEQNEANRLARKEPDELDVLFQPKKKW